MTDGVRASITSSIMITACSSSGYRVGDTPPVTCVAKGVQPKYASPPCIYHKSTNSNIMQNNHP